MFQRTATRLKRKLWWQNVKLWIILIIIILVIVAVIISECKTSKDVYFVLWCGYIKLLRGRERATLSKFVREGVILCVGHGAFNWYMYMYLCRKSKMLMYSILL